MSLMSAESLEKILNLLFRHSARNTKFVLTEVGELLLGSSLLGKQGEGAVILIHIPISPEQIITINQNEATPPEDLK